MEKTKYAKQARGKQQQAGQVKQLVVKEAKVGWLLARPHRGPILSDHIFGGVSSVGRSLKAVFPIKEHSLHPIRCTGAKCGDE